ncbi:hypothetical protein RvY_17338 [Ramazzottius varieornatus]|uniref:glutathione transferase n=1 Tax=Ramazzottius varieornatus TaxID=947166 RepID=A0A1D1W1T5_RAMVA|nr:hypothetical protein RvY_17338 [Ramazzottius varieornatus]
MFRHACHGLLALAIVAISFAYSNAEETGPKPANITLHYFNVPWSGRDAPVRWVLAYGAGESWTFHGVERAQWADLKSTTPFGQLPYIEIDGKPLGQTYAILRYLAKQYGLSGQDDWENAQIDAVAEYIRDAGQGYAAYAYARMSQDEGAMKKAGDEYANVTIQPFLAKLERLLQDNKAGHDFLVGSKPSWADILLTTQVDRALKLKADLLQSYPLLKAHTDRIHNLKGIKEWIAKHPV